MLRFGRAVLVRPSDLAEPPVPLCDAARAALRENKTLLLMKGPLLKVPLVDAPPMFVAGYIFREPSLSPTHEAPSGCTRGARTSGRLILEALIVAERLERIWRNASRPGSHKRYEGQIVGRATSKITDETLWTTDDFMDQYRRGGGNGEPFTSDGMFDWHPKNDVYEYGAGQWDR